MAKVEYEDLVAIGRSAKLASRVHAEERVLGTKNLIQGVKSRRGDGTFGETVPGTIIVSDPGYVVARGRVATVEIGVEMKILAKALIKQIDRVIGDLQKQVAQFKRGGGDPICVGLVGVNHAPYTVSHEGERQFRTDGRQNRHPIQEAEEAERRLREMAAPFYDEFVVLRYAATNDAPYAFSWVNYNETYADYGAALVRISRKYDQRF
jgi:hypothetical protein